MNILAIMCHPDDMEIYCGGTLVKYAKQGHNVTVCHVANGNMGHVVIMPDELREIRLGEARAAAAIGGFSVVTTDFGDLTVNGASVEQQLAVTKVIRDAKPDLIITHDPADYCSDHREVSQLVLKASFDATCPHFHPELGEAADLTPIYYSDTYRGLGFEPTEYVDITDEIETKLQMAACHKSQIVWLKDHDDIDLLEDMRSVSRFRGYQCSVKYAECFRPLMLSGRIPTKRMLP